MEDRELIELAAKAAGIGVAGFSVSAFGLMVERSDGGWWDPLDDDGDAFRLMVSSNIAIERCACTGRFYVGVYRDAKFMAEESYKRDSFETMRRAIVWAAAEIGKAMP